MRYWNAVFLLLLAAASVNTGWSWKPPRIISNSSDYIIVDSKSGFANRVRVLAAYLYLKKSLVLNVSRIIMVWELNAECNGHFLDVMEPIANVTFITQNESAFYEAGARYRFPPSFATFPFILHNFGITSYGDRHLGIFFSEIVLESFIPTPSIWQEVVRFVGKNEICNTMSVHVRSTDFEAWMRKNKNATKNNCDTKIRKIRNGTGAVFLMTDSAASRKAFMQLHNRTISGAIRTISTYGNFTPDPPSASIEVTDKMIRAAYMKLHSRNHTITGGTRISHGRYRKVPTPVSPAETQRRLRSARSTKSTRGAVTTGKLVQLTPLAQRMHNLMVAHGGNNTNKMNYSNVSYKLATPRKSILPLRKTTLAHTVTEVLIAAHGNVFCGNYPSSSIFGLVGAYRRVLRNVNSSSFCGGSSTTTSSYSIDQAVSKTNAGLPYKDLQCRQDFQHTKTADVFPNTICNFHLDHGKHSRDSLFDGPDNRVAPGQGQGPGPGENSHDPNNKKDKARKKEKRWGFFGFTQGKKQKDRLPKIL
jgi:hypothetical protein